MCQFTSFLYILIASLGLCQSNAQTVINYDASSGYHLTVDALNYEVKGVAGEENLEILKD